jgi:RNA polymerase sigma factor (sigma-70 family)
MAGSALDVDRLLADNVDLAEMACRMVTGRVADDHRQAALVAVWRAAQRFDPALGVPFRAFALRRARGAVYDELRDERRRRREIAVVDELVEVAATDPSTEVAALARVELAAVLRAASKLPGRWAEVLLRRAAGETLEEIGAGWCTPKNVFLLEQQARQRLLRRTTLTAS